VVIQANCRDFQKLVSGEMTNLAIYLMTIVLFYSNNNTTHTQLRIKCLMANRETTQSDAQTCMKLTLDIDAFCNKQKT